MILLKIVPNGAEIILAKEFVERSFDGEFTLYAEKLGHLGVTQESTIFIDRRRLSRKRRVNMHLTSMDAIIRAAVEGDYFNNFESQGLKSTVEQKGSVRIINPRDIHTLDEKVIREDDLVNTLQEELASLDVAVAEIITN